MAARSLNKVQLIGNLTRDPELRYTPQGTAVCSFGLATNRTWTTESGDKREDTEFHRIVSWNKLAELCSQLLFKGRRVFVEGRLQTRQWTAQDGTPRTTTEVVISEMIILDSKRAPGEGEEGVSVEPQVEPAEGPEAVEKAKTEGSEKAEKQPKAKAAPTKKGKKGEEEMGETKEKEEIKEAEEAEESEDIADDIPF